MTRPGYLIAVAAGALAASVYSWQLSATLHQERTDPYGAAAALVRFAPAIPRLPASGRIGYISDVAGSAGDLVLFSAGNALAPRVPVPMAEDPKLEWAVGNFAHPGDFAAIGQAFGYRIVADMGNGLVLYRKAVSK